MTNKEKYYDEFMAPKLLELAKEAQVHGLSFLSIVEWAPGKTGRTHYAVQGEQGLAFRMTNWAAQCHGNVDSFWLAMQRYAIKFGHSSIFLHNQGIPEQSEMTISVKING